MISTEGFWRCWYMENKEGGEHEASSSHLHTHLCYARIWLIRLFSLTSILFLTREFHTRTTLYHIFPRGKNTSSLCINRYKEIFLSQMIYFIPLHLVFSLQYLHCHCLTSTFWSWMRKLKVLQYQENTDILYKHFTLSLSHFVLTEADIP